MTPADEVAVGEAEVWCNGDCIEVGAGMATTQAVYSCPMRLCVLRSEKVAGFALSKGPSHRILCSEDLSGESGRLYGHLRGIGGRVWEKWPVAVEEIAPEGGAERRPVSVGCDAVYVGLELGEGAKGGVAG